MTTETIDSLADSVFVSIKAYCDAEMDRRIAKLVASFEQRLEEIPAGKDGRDGKDGANGKDMNVAEVWEALDLEEHLNVLVNLRVSEIPKAKNGADAVVDYDLIRGEIEKMIPDPIRGDKGSDGAKGEPGADAVVDYDQIVAEVAKLIPEPVPGDRGEPGVNGKDGADGRNGVDGQNGQHGINGKDGEPGRDAVQIDVLPAIDVERSYPRGTYASYKGGRIRALRNTDPITEGIEKAGWCIDTDGIAEVVIDQGDDLRTFGIAVELTSGKAIVQTFALPVILDRGVFKAGEDYAKGDCVTWNGQMFIAQRDTKEEPMSIGATDWRLSVKRGRDGKDGKDGTPGTRGDEGPRGRDLTHMGPNGEKYA